MNKTELDYTPVSTPAQVKEFIEFSPIWKDMQRELDVWLVEIHMMLENLDGEASYRALDRLGGCAEAVRNLLNFPHVLMTNADSGNREAEIGKQDKKNI
jgi:hypothetical protein